MPDIDSLLEKTSKKKFKKSTYRPWNYMDEIKKEEEEKSTKQDEELDSVLDHAAHNHVLQTEEHEINTIENQKKIENDLVSISYNNFNNEETTHINKKIVAIEKNKPISSLYLIIRLSGHQKIIFAFILERCLSRGSLSSGMITSETLTSITKTSLNMVNTSIQRLVDKELIYRENGKRGRGGFYCFGLSQEVKEAALEYRRLSMLDTADPVNSKAEYIEQLNVDGKKNSSFILPEEWEELDIEPLKSIGFARGHLVQLYKQSDLEVSTLQDSIYHFAYDLTYNNKGKSITKSSPIAYFMAILKRATVYTAPVNYETPKDRAIRELLERKKSEKENRDFMINELLNIEFDQWHDKLSQEEKDQIIPLEIRSMRINAPKLASLKTYFTENVWPKIIPKEI